MWTVQVYGLLLLWLVAGFCANWSVAQDYPNRVIRIQTSGIGARPDMVARILAKDLAESLGQSVVVENRAQGPVLGATVAKAAPDGYTLMVAGDSLWVGQLFNPVPYDALRDFAPIGVLTKSPNLFVVHPSLPVKTVGELIKLAKANPGALAYSHGAPGGAGHIAMEHIKYLTKVDILRVSYKDQASQNGDTLSGRVPMTFGNVVTWIGFVKQGKLRAIATGGATRSSLFPDLPTVSETIPGVVTESSLGFFAPAKTPDAILNRLNVEAKRIMEKTDLRRLLMDTGQEPGVSTPKELGDMIKSQLDTVTRLMKVVDLKGGGQ